MCDYVRKLLTRKATIQRKRGRGKKSIKVELPPSKRLVMAFYAALTVLIALIVLEIVHIVVLKTFNVEIFAAITGLIATLFGTILGVKG